MATLQAIARKAADNFERATRPDGTEYVRTKDDAPEWIREEVVFPAHGDMLPDDWRYETVWLACEWIAENGADDDAPGEFADSRVDIYTARACAWLASHLSRPGYCDEATEEFGPPDPPDVLNLIARGQYLEASEVYGLVLSALERIAAETEIPAAIVTRDDEEDAGGITAEGLALGHRYVMGNVNCYCPKCSEEQGVTVLDCAYDLGK